MTALPLIGVMGSYGAVGSAVVETLARSGEVRLRLGGRHAGRLDAQRALVPGAAALAVELEDRDGLARFCDGCAVVVNCAGPSYVVLDRVAEPAWAAGADYVDPGGDEPLLRLLASVPGARRALLTAGMMPGLSSLIPRWLAGDGRAVGLTAYVGTLDHLSAASAADYLLSLASGTHGEAKAGWRGGERATAVLEPEPDAPLPFFPGRVTAYPYLSTETERLARALALREVSWFNVFDGTQMLAALGRLQGVPASELAAAAAELARAAELDLFGRDPYQLMVFQLDRDDGSARSAVLRATGTYELTGAVAARAALELLRDPGLPVGAHFADEVLDPSAVPEIVSSSHSVTLFETFDGPLEHHAAVEEGVL
jgi:hypothetical protein